MKVISQRELRNASAAVMDAVERGESFQITRHGAVVAELQPPVAHTFVASATLKAAFASLPPVNLDSLRADADAVLGEDRVGT
jgi:antitoxin (DNA-binding transcriptional repressor) of toxin-antitoxin stability system